MRLGRMNTKVYIFISIYIRGGPLGRLGQSMPCQNCTGVIMWALQAGFRLGVDGRQAKSYTVEYPPELHPMPGRKGSRLLHPTKQLRP